MCIYGWEYHEGVKPFEEFCQTSTPSTSAINRNDNYGKSNEHDGILSMIILKSARKIIHPVWYRQYRAMDNRPGVR